MSLDQILMLPPGYGFDGGAWTPASLPSLVAWVNPNAYAYSDAGTVAAVHDDPLCRLACSYPNQTYYAEQATLGARPIYKIGANGKASFVTDGTDDDFLLTIPSTAFTACEIWVAWKRVGTFTSDNIFDARRASDGNPIINISDAAGLGTSARARTRNNAGSLNDTASTAVSTSWQTVAAQFTGSATNILTNNTVRQTVAQTGTITIDQIGLARNGFSASGLSNGEFGHIVVTNAVLSAGDSALLQAYLEAEYPT